MTKAVQDVIRHLKEVNYETVKLPLIYQLLNELNDKDYISINMSDIFTTVKGVIQQSFDKFGGYDIIDLKFNRNFDDTIQDTNYKEIVLLVKEAQQKYIQETQESQVQNFLNSLGTREVAEAYKDIEFQKNLFLLINNTSFSKEIVGVTNKKIWAFISFIESRYLSISNANEFYQNEIDDINTFINNLQKNISTAVIDKLKRDNLNELLSTLIRTVSHISNPVTDK